MKTNSIFAVILIILVLTFLYIRAGTALQGILWGTDKTMNSIGNVINSEKSIDPKDISINFGIYDPGNQFPENRSVSIDHIFIDWNDKSEIENLPNYFNDSKSKDRWLMISLEPWHRANRNDSSVLLEVVTGAYDDIISDFCFSLNESETPVIIRWGHEMDNLTGRYAWAVENADDYKLAYEYFVSRCRDHTTNTYYMWSPVGENDKSLSYLPDLEYVDIIGFSLYYYPEYLKSVGNPLASLSSLFTNRYERFAKFGKQIYIAEFGIEKTYSHGVKEWNDFVGDLDKYESLKTIVFFNEEEHPNVWPGVPDPDWHVDENMFPFFVNE